jgi:large subunit ribosomal protein L19
MSRADEIVAGSLKEKLPEFEVGDSVDVQVRIREGDKTRIQLFSGTVIRLSGAGIRRNFTVRRIVQGEGVERIFPFHAPCVVDVIVRKKGRVRRARLYYLRERTGKATRLKERIWSGKGEGEGAPAGGEEGKAEAAADKKAAPAGESAAKAPARPEARGEGKPAAGKETKPEAKKEGKPEARKEAKGEGKKESKPEPKPEAKGEAKAEAKPEKKSETPAKA